MKYSLGFLNRGIFSCITKSEMTLCLQDTPVTIITSLCIRIQGFAVVLYSHKTTQNSSSDLTKSLNESKIISKISVLDLIM